jgi:N-methylhydantoinase A
VLEIGRASRPIPFDLDYARNPPLLPRHLRFEIKERMNAKGDVLIASDPAEIAIENKQNGESSATRRVPTS